MEFNHYARFEPFVNKLLSVFNRKFKFSIDAFPQDLVQTVLVQIAVLSGQTCVLLSRLFSRQFPSWFCFLFQIYVFWPGIGSHCGRQLCNTAWSWLISAWYETWSYDLDIDPMNGTLRHRQLIFKKTPQKHPQPNCLCLGKNSVPSSGRVIQDITSVIII